MINCPLCSSGLIRKFKNNITSVYTNRSYDLDLCEKCKFIFTSPEPTKDALDDIYKNKYSYDIHLIIHPEKKYRARKIAKFIKGNKEIKTILEIGTMYGFLLMELQKSGYDCTGLEIDEAAVKYCREHNLDVRNETFENFLQKNDRKYDLVIMSHVLEHITNPRDYVDKIREILNKKGMILLVVPNALSLSSKVFGRFWGYWQVPVHVNHFCSKSLKYLFRSLNFQVDIVRKFGGDSLLFLSTLANILGTKSTEIKMNGIKKKIIGIYSAIFKYWYIFGDDDIIILAKMNE